MGDSPKWSYSISLLVKVYSDSTLDASSQNAAFKQAPLYFVATGGIYEHGLWYAGSDSSFWGATASTATDAYCKVQACSRGFYFAKDRTPQNLSFYRYNGRPIRCVAARED